MRKVPPFAVVLTLVCGSALTTACADGPQKSIVAPPTEAPYVVAVTPRLDTLGPGASRQLIAQVRQADRVVTDRPVEWKSTDPAIASVSAGGLVTAVGDGSARIVARVGQSADSATIVVRTTQVPFMIVPGAVSATLGDTLQLAVVTPTGMSIAASGASVIWSSSDSTIAAVSNDGLVTTLQEGDVTLTAQSGGQVATAALKINGATISSVTVSPTNSSIYPSQSEQLTATARDDSRRPVSGKLPAWSTSDPSIATVDADGKVTGMAKGVAVISVRMDNKRASATVNVLPTPVASVALSLGKTTLGVGQTTTTTVVLKDAAGNTLTDRVVAYQSSNSALVTVNSAGVVTAIAAGSVTITAISEGKTASAGLTVAASRAATVTITPGAPTALVGRTAQLGLDVRDATGAALVGRPATWASAAPAIATVSSTGLVSAIAVGTATISATVDGIVATAQFTVTTVPVTTVAVSPTQLSLAPGGSAQLSVAAAAGATTSGSTRPVSWSTSNPAVATVDAAGIVTAVSAGTARVSATVEGVTGGSDVTVSAPAPAAVASVGITFNSPQISPGQSTQAVAVVRDAAGNVLTGRTVSWSSADPTLATVSNTGLVTSVSAGSVTIIATSEGVRGAATLVITATAPVPVASVALSISPSTINAGTTGQATVTLKDANGNILTGRTIAWSTTNPAIATVGVSGLITGVGAGTATISATSEGKTGSATVTIASVSTNLPAVANIAVSVQASSLPAGHGMLASATLTDASGNVLTGRVVTWSSSNPTVATVSSTGQVSALSAGSTSIIASSDGKSGSAGVVVTQPGAVASVAVTLNSSTLTVGQSTQATATARDATGAAIGGKSVTWTISSGSAFASISTSGSITGVSAGVATVSATVDGIAGSASLTVTTTTTAPPPPPPPPTGDVTARILGNTLTSSETNALGGSFAQYESNFVTFDEQQWATNGPQWSLIDYYDRALIYYAWYRRTGDAKYLSRANAVALDYRKNYLEAAGFLIQPHWSMMDGVALHYLATGDEASRTAVGRIADLFTGLGYRDQIGIIGQTDNRVQARYIVSLLLAHQIQAPSTGVPAGGIGGGHDWAAELRRALPLILSTQSADGAWRLSNCGDGGPYAVHPFTTGLLLDALTRYYDLFEADSRIPPAIKKAVDYLWANDWLPTSSAFKYVERECPAEGGPVPAPDLNNLIVNGYAWTYKMSGDVTYKQRADQIFAGAVANAWISPTKQFNQVYSSSFRYLSFRK